MNDLRYLKLPLQILAVYAIVAGILLMVPTLSELVFDRPTFDPAAAAGWGASLIPLGLFAWTIAVNTKQHGTLSWVLVIGLLIGIAAFVYYWSAGAFTARNVLGSIVMNGVLAGWISLILVRAKAPVAPAARRI